MTDTLAQDIVEGRRLKPAKPLGAKAYGSIGHLPSSRMGPGDHSVHEGQAAICNVKPRRGDRIVVSEKLDGACMAVANVEGQIIGLTRAGYKATDALYEHLRRFDPYVDEHYAAFEAILRPGERLVGEWLAMAHGTIYDNRHPSFAPFIPFDIIRGTDRVLRDEFVERVGDRFIVARTLADGAEPFSVEAALEALGTYGFHGATEPVEGAVWRVERDGRVDFLAKYVRPDKIDGKYLPDVSGEPPIWMFEYDPHAPDAHTFGG